MAFSIDKLIELDAKNPKTILFIGESFLDVYVYGTIETCQDDCVKFTGTGEILSVDGGSANAKNSIKAWKSKGIVVDGMPSNKMRFLVGEKIVFRYDPFDKRDPLLLSGGVAGPHDRTKRTGLVIKGADAVLISDYDKGLMTPEFIRYVIDECHALGIPCVADAKRNPKIYDGAILKGNAAYFSKWPTNYCQQVMTRGADRPTIYQSRIRLPDKPPVKCVNHVGAGDCFAAHMTLALAHGFTLVDSVEFAHSAGRVYVQHPHNRPPSIDEIRRDLKMK